MVNGFSIMLAFMVGASLLGSAATDFWLLILIQQKSSVMGHLPKTYMPLFKVLVLVNLFWKLLLAVSISTIAYLLT